uniref:VP n=1 Tax=Phylloscopus proregulus parvoviridae sp. TaxID=2794532 RepID=A0A8A4XEG4_9VIRU|nr:MAG: VP [Phylloscopus proregulus parvoviridae sp.]
MKFLYPGHNYLGPGNPLENGPAVDKSDQIAKKHDYAYHNATSIKDIYESDRQAIGEFARDFVIHPNLPSLAGAVGLGSKYLVEKNVTGVVYPKIGMSGRKEFFKKAQANENRRQAARQPTIDNVFPARRVSGGSSSKRPAEGEPEVDEQEPGTSSHQKKIAVEGNEEMAAIGNDSTDVEMADMPTAANGSATSSSSSGMRGSAEFPIGIRQQTAKYTRVYSKQYHLRLFNRLNEYETPTVNGVVYNDYIPNYHEIPCDLLAFYLNFSEMQRLRNKTQVRVKRCDVDVANHTAIISYETNAAGTQIGNNNLGITLCQLDPMIVRHRTGRANLRQQGAVIRNVFWGIDVNTLPPVGAPVSNMPGLSAEFITRNYNNRYRYRTVRQIVNRSHNTVAVPNVPMQFYNVNRHVIKRKNVSITEGNFTTWSHVPKSGVVFAQNFGVMPPGSVDTAPLTINMNDHHNARARGITNVGVTPNTGFGNVQMGLPAPTSVNPVGQIAPDIFRNIGFDPDTMSRILIDDPYVNMGDKASHVPALIIGMDPQVGIVESTGVSTAVPCHVDLIITARIELEITEGVNYDDSNYGLLQEINYKFPNWRLYSNPSETAPPQALQGPMHQENALDAEVVFNAAGTNDNIQSTWNYPPPITPTASDVLNKEHDKTVEDENKFLVAELVYPYMTRSRTKKHFQKIDEEKKKKQGKRSTPNIIEKDVPEYDDYESDNLN